MKILGRAIGILTDKVTGEKTVAFDQTNHIQDRYLVSRCGYWDSGSGIGNNIIIIWGDDSPVTQRRDWNYIPDDSLRGTNIAGITSPDYIWYEPNDSVHVKQVTQRFDAPASVDRVINVIGLESVGTVIDTAVTLTVPCIQTTSQTLDVFYRIQVPYSLDYWDTNPAFDSIVPTPYELEKWAAWLFGYAAIPVKNYTHGANWADKLNPRLLKAHIEDSSEVTDLAKEAILPATSEYFKIGERHSLPIANSIGKLISTSWFNNTSIKLLQANNILSGVANSTPVQNVFGHSATALVPFYDASTTQGGLGTMVLNGSAWVNPDWPKMLRINVTGTGALGVGTYKVQMRNLIGFNLNTYQNKPQEVIGYHYYNDHLTDGFRIVRGNNEQTSTSAETRKATPVVRYDEKTILAGWTDEIMISDVTSQTGTRFASDTVPAMSVTDISQFCKDESTGDIYVACRVNGAFRISADLTTVTRFYTATTGLSGVTGCYGINVTTAGRVWAYFDGGVANEGLYYSDDSGATWTKPTFAHAAIDADPTLVTQIVVDPAHANDHVAVIYGGPIVSSQRELLIAWWDLAGIVAVGGTAVQGPVVLKVVDYLGALNANQQPSYGFWSDFTNKVTLMKALRCSPNDSFWLTSMRRLNAVSQTGYVCKFDFGTETTTNIPSNDLYGNNWQNGGWGVDETGADAFFYLGKDSQDDGLLWGTYSKVQVMLRSSMTYDFHEYQFANAKYDFEKDAIVYMGGGIHLCFIPTIYSTGAFPMINSSAGGMAIVSALPYDSTRDTDATGSAYDNEFYPEYGWDGVNWVKGNAGSKAMHAATEDLIQGLTIAFDDASGTAGWEDTDFYTSIIYNGIVADGSTTYEQELYLYVKPTYTSTDFEVSVLPATTRVPGHWKDFVPSVAGDWQDTANITISTSVYRITGNSYDMWNAGARSAVPAISGAVSNLASVTYLTDIDMTGIQGFVEWNNAAGNSIVTQPYQHMTGLSNIAKVGGTLDNTTIMYGILVDSGSITPDGSGLVSFSAVESGVIKATISGLNIINEFENRARIIIKTDGGIIYEVQDSDRGWMLLYEAPAGTATIEDLYFEYTSSAYDSGIKSMTFSSHITADHYLFLGNGVDNGLFANKFRLVDPATVEITFNGVAGAQVDVDDTDTVLSTGEYSVFPFSGCIRYSAADIGKTVAGSFIYLTDEV